MVIQSLINSTVALSFTVEQQSLMTIHLHHTFQRKLTFRRNRARELQYTYEREYSFILPVLRIFGVMSESKANSYPLLGIKINNSESPGENSIFPGAKGLMWRQTQSLVHTFPPVQAYIVNRKSETQHYYHQNPCMLSEHNEVNRISYWLNFASQFY